MAAGRDVVIAALRTVTTQEWNPELDEITDAADALVLAVVLTVHGIDVNGGSTVLALETAVDRAPDAFAQLGNIATISSNPSDLPANYLACFEGSGVGGTGQPACARYVRATVSQAAGASITFSIMATLKS